MKALRWQSFFRSVFQKKQVVFWFSSQEIFLSWEKKKKQLTLPVGAGFSDGQIHDVNQAVATLTGVLEKEGIRVGHPLVSHTATVFVATASSPLERDLVREVFRKSGFQKVNLVSYTTALRAFAQRQAIRTGVGFYFGSDVSEAMVFSPQDQQVFSLDYSLVSIQEGLQQFFRSHHKLEISLETAKKVYQSLSKPTSSRAIRGRNIQTQQVETKTLGSQDIEKVAGLFKTKLRQELQLVLNAPLFTAENPDYWVIIGDAFLNNFVQQTHQAKTVFLHSELEVIQGVQWL